MQFVQELRDIARNCPDPAMQQLVAVAADDLSYRLAALTENATFDNMRALNGAWARAWRLAELAKPDDDGGMRKQPESRLIPFEEKARA